MNSRATEEDLDGTLRRFARKFREKIFPEEDLTTDVLMELMGVDPDEKARHRQYYGRELGSLWEALLKDARRRADPAVPYFFPEPGDKDWPCDIVSGNDCIDAKYRFGSGDNGTIRNLVRNAEILSEMSYRPVLLVFRGDSLDRAIKSLQQGGWTAFAGDEALEYVRDEFGFDLDAYLRGRLGD